MYESTMESLEYLYPKLSVGRYVIIDDYYTTQFTKAIDDYRRDHDIAEPRQTAAWPRFAVYWQRRG
jgi:O-methyltransferase